MFELIKSCFKWYKTWHTFPILDWVKAAEYYKRGEFKHAADYYKRGIKLHKSHEVFKFAQNDYISSLIKDGQYLECSKYLIETLEDSSQQHRHFLQLSNLYLRFGERKSRRDLLIACINRYGINEFNISQLIHSCIDMGEINSFSARIRLSLGTIKKNIFLNTAIARWNYYLNPTLENRAIIADIAAQSNAPVEAQLLYAEILMSESRWDYARKHFVKAMIIAPKDPRPYIGSAKCLHYLGLEHHLNSALGMALESVRLSCWRNYEALQILAESYVKTGDRISALMVADLAILASKKNDDCISDELTQLYNSLTPENL